MDKHLHVNSSCGREGKAYLALKVGLSTLISAGVIWGIVSVGYALTIVSTLKHEQTVDFKVKSKKLNKLFEAAQISISIADENNVDAETIFKRTENALRNHFEKFHITYSLALVDTGAEIKLTSYGSSKLPPMDFKLKDHFSSHPEGRVTFDLQGNPILIRRLLNFDGEAYLMISLSMHSLNQSLQAEHSAFSPSSQTKDLENEEFETFHLPFGREWYLTYKGPRISLLDELVRFIFFHKALLLIAIIVTTLALALLYISIANKIENDYKRKIRNQSQDNKIMSNKLNEHILALEIANQKISAIRIQREAVSTFLSEIDNDIKLKESLDEHGNLEPVWEDIKIEDLLRSILNCFEASRIKKKIDIQLVTPMGTPTTYGNRIAMKEIMYNLIARAYSNAKTKVLIQVEQPEDNIHKLNLHDDGYDVGLGKYPHFSDKSELSVVAMNWEELIEACRIEGISVSRNKNAQEGNGLRIEIFSKHNQKIHRGSNVVPIR